MAAKEESEILSEKLKAVAKINDEIIARIIALNAKTPNVQYTIQMNKTGLFRFLWPNLLYL